MRTMRWQIDEIGRGRIRGWALNARAPQQRPILDILIDGRFVGQALANHWRADLKGAGIGDGFHGFEWRNPRLEDPEARKRISVEWPRLGFWGRRAPAAAGTMNLRCFRSPETYLAARLSEVADFPKSPPGGLTAPASILTRLLAPVEGQNRAPGLGRAISAYQSYVLHRFRQEPEFEPSLTLGEYRRFLRWYIQHYGGVRANLRIPLSEADLAFLHQPVTGEDSRIEAMALFAQEFGARPGFELADWAFYNAESLGLSDCLHFPTLQNETDRVALFSRQHPLLQGLEFTKSKLHNGIARLLETLHPTTEYRGVAGGRLEAASFSIRDAERVDVQIIGPFSKALGVGESCRRMAKALAMTGCSLRTCDFSIDYPNEGTTGLDFSLEDVGPAKVNLIHLNLEEIPKVMAYWPDVFTGAVNIAVPYLELSHLAPEQELGLALVDRVFAATHHIRRVIGDRLPVDVVGSAVEETNLPDRRLARAEALGAQCSPEAFVVLVSGDALSGLDRKNLMGAVRAFRAAFPANPRCRLVIKTHSIDRTHDARQLRIWNDLGEMAAEDPRIILFDKHLDVAAYRTLQAACDVYLSLHRAEGLGYHVLECMQLGLPCIVTDYSGTRDFSSESTALLVGYELVPVRTWEYPFTRGEQKWANPILDDAVQHLRLLESSPGHGSALGLQARQHIHAHYSLSAFARRLEAALAPLIPGMRR